MSSKNSDESPDRSPDRTRGRPRGFDEAALIDRVTDVFWRRGYHGASIGDLAEATGAARASLYRLHGDKKALFLAALDRYAQRFEARVADALSRPAPPRERVAETLRASAKRLTDPTAPPGCLRCRSTLELGGLDPDIDRKIAEVNARFTNAMARLLAPDGEPTSGTAPARAALLTVVVNGMVTAARAGTTRAELYRVVDAALDAAVPA